MTFCLIFINWNDSFYIPFIAKHYAFCDRIIMYDNHSTDNSRELAKSYGFEVRLFGNKGELNDNEYLKVKNNAWKGLDYDFVIVVDADEFVKPDPDSFVLPHLVTLPEVQGYNMISETLPEKDIFEINTGVPDENYSKQAVFSPKLKEINYQFGAHQCRPEGNKVRGGKCELYHFRMIGGVERLIERHKVYRKRMSRINQKLRLGWHYTTREEQKQKEWDELKSKAVKLW